LLNRALRGTYPPGSTYKPFMALAALETGSRSPEYTVSDPGYFMFGNHRFRDDKEGGHGAVNMYRSIVVSCDTYYYTLANEMGVDTIHDQMQRFGFGELTGIDILGETRGLLPSTEWKRRAYKRADQQRWYAGETISQQRGAQDAAPGDRHPRCRNPCRDSGPACGNPGSGPEAL
jgi:penicillin-binding protein 2